MPPDLSLNAINAGISLVTGTQKPDAPDQQENGAADQTRAQLRNAYTAALIENIVADRKMRQQYASRILRYLEIYSGSVLTLILLCGSKLGGFGLEQGVLAALVGSTAIAAIGLVGFIARGLFPTAPPQLPDR